MKWRRWFVPEGPRDRVDPKYISDPDDIDRGWWAPLVEAKTFYVFIRTDYRWGKLSSHDHPQGTLYILVRES